MTKRKPDAGLFSPDAGLFSPDAGVVVWEVFVEQFVRLAGLADLPKLACVNSEVVPRVRAELKARLARLLKEEREALMEIYYSTGGEDTWLNKDQCKL